MANSSSISAIKDKVIKEILKNDLLIKVIAPKDPENLINTHIFRYHQNPNTLNTAITFLTIQVHIPKNEEQNKRWVKPILEIWIISHEKKMNLGLSFPGITADRNDYLSQLLDDSLNGRTGFGSGELILRSNEEGAYAPNYLYRKMIFETLDLNDSWCRHE